jgi:hypothetical protein
MESYLCKKLVEINKKYESTTFVDIDFVDLFDLTNIKEFTNMSIVHKKITTKYYNLALKYHPDKYKDNVSDIKVKNCLINVDDIKNGLFISFINDIYKLLINMISKDQISLTSIIKGETEDILNKHNIVSDYNNLKRKQEYDQYKKPSEEQVNNFEKELNKKIQETKLDEEELIKRIKLEQDKREQLKVDNLFKEKIEAAKDVAAKIAATNTNISDNLTNDIFNNIFMDTKNDVLKDDVVNELKNLEIEAFDNNKLILSKEDKDNIGSVYNTHKLSNTISEISEAFEPLRVGNIQSKKLSYDEYLEKRRLESEMFKNPSFHKK